MQKSVNTDHYSKDDNQVAFFGAHNVLAFIIWCSCGFAGIPWWPTRTSEGT